MIASLFRRSQFLPRAVVSAAWLAFGFALGGCSSMSDEVSSAFADPSKYTLYDCKQLEAERKRLATRSAELQGLMARAQGGVAGPVVAEIAYRNEYIAVRGQAKNAEEAWQLNKCRETPATAGPPANDKSGRPMTRSGNAVY